MTDVLDAQQISRKEVSLTGSSQHSTEVGRQCDAAMRWLGDEGSHERRPSICMVFIRHLELSKLRVDTWS